MDSELNGRVNVNYPLAFLFNSDFVGRNHFKKQDWLKDDIWPFGYAGFSF